MQWNLHVVGHAIETDVRTAVDDFTKALSTAGHVVDKVFLTTDDGVKEISPIVDEAAKVASAVDPSLAPIADVAEDAVNDAPGILQEIENDLEKAKGLFGKK